VLMKSGKDLGDAASGTSVAAQCRDEMVGK
jgi:hypothetical protein